MLELFLCHFTGVRLSLICHTRRCLSMWKAETRYTAGVTEDLRHRNRFRYGPLDRQARAGMNIVLTFRKVLRTRAPCARRSQTTFPGPFPLVSRNLFPSAIPAPLQCHHSYRRNLIGTTTHESEPPPVWLSIYNYFSSIY